MGLFFLLCNFVNLRTFLESKLFEASLGFLRNLLWLA